MIDTNLAQHFLQAKLSVLPASRQEKRPALAAWKSYQQQLPSVHQINAWFANERDAVCVVCGKVSGNLEVLDFDNHGELFPKWKESIPAELLAKLVMEQTPSGGYHVAYRCTDEVCGNIKLAQGFRDGKPVTLIETRGEGGLVLCAPTEGYALQQGEYTNLPCITPTERQILLDGATVLDEIPAEIEPAQSLNAIDESTFFDSSSDRFELRPGDDFNERGDIRVILQKHGWRSLGTKPDGNEYWTRPGKKENANSASLRDGCFFVFSTNAFPFKPGVGYSPFRVYTILEHNGDYTLSTNALLQAGYGKPDSELLPNIDEIIANFLKSNREKDTFTAAELMKKFKTMKEPVIDGLLRRSEVMNVVAAPKTGKSWLILQLAYSLAFGYDWMGFPCRKSKVLLMDNELHVETLSARLIRVATGMALSCDAPEIDNLIINVQRQKRHTVPEIVKLASQIKEQQIDVVIIDALYRALPQEVDENSNGQITQVYNDLDQFAQLSGAAVILVHHTSKGNQATKGITDVGSGAGAQSRAPDTHLVLRPHKEPGVVVVGCCVRSFPPVESFCLKRNELNLWSRTTNYSTDELDGKTETTPASEKRKRTVSDAEIEFFNRIGEFSMPMPKTAFMEMLKERLNLSRTKAESLFEILSSANVFEIRRGEGNSNQSAIKMIHFSSGYEERYRQIIPKSERRIVMT